jgi:hypothetical protein
LDRKLFIHAGPTKTGTTAIQNFLRDYDGSQVLYPKTGQFGSGAHHNLVYNFLDDFSNSGAVRDDCESMFERVAVIQPVVRFADIDSRVASIARRPTLAPSCNCRRCVAV